MVRLSNTNNRKIIETIIFNLFHIQENFTKIVEINNPYIYPCIYVLWHGDQCGLYGIQDKGTLNVLISNSPDGEIIANVIKRMGFKTVRGSSARKGSISGTMQLIKKLNEGERVAITIDGPRGPLHKVKKGAVTLAKETGAPIIPLRWYSEDITFINLPSWDKMTFPLAYCEIINLYGEPIYIKPEDDDNEACDKIAAAMAEVERRSHEEFIKAKQQKLWKKQREQEKLKKRQK